MKEKLMFISLMLLFFLTPLYCQELFLLGEVQVKEGLAKVNFKKGSRNEISIYLPDKISPLNLYTLKEIREQFQKYLKWHAIAVKNKSRLNKKIGKLGSYESLFVTSNGKYYLALIESRTGQKIMRFNDLKAIERFLELIGDKNIDYHLNKEKREKEQEESLFK